jgi:hypothetical protein
VIQNFTINVQYPVTTIAVSFPNVSITLSQMTYSGGNVCTWLVVDLGKRLVLFLVPVRLPIFVQDTSAPQASNALLLMDFNDSNPLTSSSVINASLPYSGAYTFNTPGIFLVNFTVYNGASAQTQIVKIGINAQFNNYELSVCYLLPTLTSPLSDTCNLTLDSSRYVIPKQSQFVVYVKWSNPSK